MARETIVFAVERLTVLLAEVDWTPLITRDLVNALTSHLRSVRVNTKNFPSHPCLASPDAERLYLRQVRRTSHSFTLYSPASIVKMAKYDFLSLVRLYALMFICPDG